MPGSRSARRECAIIRRVITPNMNRRALLLGSVGLAGLAAAGYSRAARALTIEEVYPNSAVGLALKDRGGGQGEPPAPLPQPHAPPPPPTPAPTATRGDP